MAEEDGESTDLVVADTADEKALEPGARAEENKAVIMANTFGNGAMDAASASAKKTAATVLGAYFEHFAFKYTSYGDVLASNAYERKLSEQKANRLLDGLDTIEPKDVTPSPTELAVPLMEQLSYTENDDLTEILIQLLVATGSKAKQHLVHPSMIDAAKNLSPDEGLILKWFGKSKVNGLSMIGYCSKDPRREMQGERLRLREYYSYLDDIPGLQFPKNAEMYVENLLSLGLFKISEGFYPEEDANGNNRPHREYQRLINNAKKKFKAHNQHAVFSSENFMFESTTKGKTFIAAVHKVAKENTTGTSTKN